MSKPCGQAWSGALPCRPEDKLAAFMYAVQEVVPTGQPTIIFASTRHHVELLSQLLRADGVPSAHVYGTMDQVHSPKP